MPVPGISPILNRVIRFFPAAHYPINRAQWSDRILQAVLFSCIAHVGIFFGTGWKPANPHLLDNSNPPMDVVLVNARSATAPVKADVYAQANLDGGGDVEEERQLSSPLPASPEDATPVPAKEVDTRIKALEQQARALLTQIQSRYSVPENVPQAAPVPEPEAKSTSDSAPDPVPEKPSTPSPVTELAARSLEMARLQARIAQDWDEYQKRPRRENAQFRAKEYAFARYVEDWRAKVERIGNLNYPEAARRRHEYGSLVLTVEINRDGSLEGVHVERSSGSRILDAAAIKIVELASPFAPFPDEMRRKVDIFGITRTWSFTQGDQLTSR